MARRRTRPQSDPFAVLGLPAGATADDVRQARNRLAKQHHPDVGGSAADMQRLNAAADAALRQLGALVPSDAAESSPGGGRHSDRHPGRVGRDHPSFTIEALPAEAFEALTIAASILGQVSDDDPPYRLDALLVDPAEASPYSSWREVAFGSPEPVRDIMNVLDTPGCVVFECVGIPGVLDSIIKGCERGTRIFSAGGSPAGEHLHTMIAKRKGLNMQFGGGPSMTHWNEAFEAVCSGQLDVTPMVGRIVGIDEVPSALDDARDANGPARIIVMPGR
mgnify:CR=1 FL=1